MQRCLGGLLTLCSVLLLVASPVRAENMSIGLGPTGHLQIVDGAPRLNAGVGGHVYFDYRWAPQISTQFTLHVTTQDGSGPNQGDDDILLFALPTVDFKYYFFKSSERFDPYAALGVGLWLTSEGTRSDGTTAFGFGANAGLGTDIYITPSVSTNLAAIFHAVGMVTSLGANNGGVLFPMTFSGSLAFHF